MAIPSKKTRDRTKMPVTARVSGAPSALSAAVGAALAAGHVVQFYESDQFLADAVAAYFKAGLAAGDACLMVATPAHREQVERCLRDAGLDLTALSRKGTFVALDADATLRTFLADDSMPDSQRFDEVIAGGQIKPLTRGGRRVRVFGEMVALLWAEEKQSQAIHLEALWNELQHRMPRLTLCCAYPMRGMAGTENAALFAEMCGQHTHVLPAESYTEQLNPAERLRAISMLQQRARSLEAEIAQREQAEERLRASEQRYRLLFEAALDGIMLVEPHGGTVVDANPAMVTLLGRDHAQIIGRTLWELGVLPDRASGDALLRELATRRTLRYDSLPLPQPGRQTRTIELVGTCFEANGGEMIQCTLRDVTQRRQMERRTEAALTALLSMAETLVADAPPAANELEALARATEGAEDGVAPQLGVATTARRLADLTRAVLSCEQLSIAAVEPETDRMCPLTLVGFSPEQERQWWAGWHPETTVASRLGAEVAARLHAGELVRLPVEQSPHRERLAPFAIQSLLLVPARIGDKLVGGLALHYAERDEAEMAHEQGLAGAVAQLIGLVVERERLQREHAEAQASTLALREANRRMSEFLSVASHELKTPVTVIKANLQLCSRRLHHAEVRRADGQTSLSSQELLRTLEAAQAMIGRSEHGADRLVRLVDDLLDASRIQAGKLELRAEPADLVAIVREAVEEQRQAHPSRTIQLVAPATELDILADHDRIGQVVTNYLTNALKYSAASRTVGVAVEADGQSSMACVRVRDEGPGLPPEEHERVWEQFHRVPNVDVLSGSGVGLGLGLHICKTIVEQHGGQVGLESAVGAGSTFWFTLPLAQTEQFVSHPHSG